MRGRSGRVKEEERECESKGNHAFLRLRTTWGAVSSEDGAVQRTWWVPGEPETVGGRVQVWPKLFMKLLSPGCKCSGLS